MSRRMVRHISLCLVLGLVMVGCASPVLITPPPPPTPLPGSVETIVVHTAAAAQTQTAALIPPSNTPTQTPLATRTPTISPTPTATVLFLPPTATSLPEGLLEDENEDGGGDGNDDNQDGYVKPTATPSEWACRVLSKSPAKGAVIKGGSNFRATWTVENIGTKTWPKKGVDFVYHSGAHLHDGKAWRDIPTTVGPGGKVTLMVSMTAPKRSSVYSTRWSLRVGKKDFCDVRFIIEVK
jgi:hypothetical protein